MNILKRVLPALLGLGLAAIIAGLTVILGAYFYLKPGLPSAETLREVKLQTPLRIYSRDGRLMAQIGEKRRTPTEYADIPDIVIRAFLAAEDDRFFEHPGFDYQGILRAGFSLLRTGVRSQGGSTITQQLATVYFFTRERTFERKAKELFLALRIESEFSKEEILSLYLNKIFFGQRAYGIGAAAEVYFGKPLVELSLAEVATIAGLPKAPSTLNPVSNPRLATARRSYVLRRMLELQFINPEEYRRAMDTPMESHLHGPIIELRAPYVTEMVRAEMVGKFGLSAYSDGYKVFTTIDSHLQSAAQLSLRKALLEYDRRHVYRGPVARNVLQPLKTQPSENTAKGAATPEPADQDMQLQELLAGYPVYRDMHLAVVLNLAEDNSAQFFVRNSGRQTLPWDRIKWRFWENDNTVGNAQQSVDEILAVGDLVYLLRTVDGGWQLAQMPEVQGAFVAMDPLDGATAALTGGFDFFASKFNRAVQAKRQPGSNFKPFVYSAALENGFTVASVVNDAPVVFADETLEDTWRPENYSRRFHGPTRMREGLVKSINLVSVRLLLGMGIRATLKHIRPFGFPPSALPRDPSLALGSGGASPWDIASGYTAFANGGYHVERYLVERIEDSTGNVVFEANPRYVCATCAPVPEPAPVDPAIIALGQFEATGATTDEKNENSESSLQLPETEVPFYSDATQMIANATDWRPDAEETPKFFDDSEAAPRIISQQNAYLIYDMMRDVIRRGTGRRIRELGRKDLAGKTGTSNERRDTWFSGFNGDIVATAWVGFDQERSLGATEEGSRTALPVWKYFMTEALAGTRDATIPRPPGLVTVRISAQTGQLAPAGYPDAIFELFREDHVPTEIAESRIDPVNGQLPDSEQEGDDIF